MTNYERALPEFRMVKHYGVLFGVQQKWLVQDGPVYTPEFFGPPNKKTDQFIDTDGSGKPLWVSCKHEWRDLPTFNREQE